MQDLFKLYHRCSDFQQQGFYLEKIKMRNILWHEKVEERMENLKTLTIKLCKHVISAENDSHILEKENFLYVLN